MPKVPAAPRTVITESVRSAPIRAPLQRIRGAGIDARGLVQGVFTAGEALARAEADLSQIRMTEAENDILTRWNTRLHTGEDAQYQKNGKAFVEGTDQTMKGLQTDIDEGLANLKTGAEKRIVSQAMVSRHQQARAKLSLKSWDERRAWDRSTAAAGIATQIESATQDPSPENLKITAFRVAEHTMAIAEIDGASDDEAMVLANQNVSKLFRAAIETVVPNDPFRAEAMLDRYVKEKLILGGDESDLRKQLKEVTLSAKASSIMNEAALANPGDLKAQLKAIDKATGGAKPSPEQFILRERARSKAVIRENAIATAEGREQQDIYRGFGEAIVQLPNRIDRFDALERLKNDEFFTWSKLSPSQKQNLENMTNAYRQDWEAWTELYQMSEAKVRAIDPWDYRHRLDDRHYEDLLEIQRSGRQGSGRKFSGTNVLTATRILNERSEGLTGNQAIKLGSLLQEIVEIREKEEGEKLKLSEVAKIADGLLIETAIPGSGLSLRLPTLQGNSQTVFQGDRKLLFELEWDDVPKAERLEIYDYLFDLNKDGKFHAAQGDEPGVGPSQFQVIEEFARRHEVEGE